MSLFKKFDGPYDCPATGFKEKCRKEKCPEWVHILGNHPQTGAVLDKEDCARKWVPLLLLNVANMERQTGAAVESARNEARRDTEAVVTTLLRQPMRFSPHGALVDINDAPVPRLPG